MWAHMRTKLIAVAMILPVWACTDDGVTPPPESPELVVTSPARGTMEAGLAWVEVQGTVAPSPSGSPISKVEVNGNIATLAEDGSWSVMVQVRPGVNLLETKATAKDGGTADDTRGVVTGTFRGPDATIENALSAGLSKQTFAVLGRKAADLVEQVDLAAMVMPMNPVVAKGLSSSGEEDCLFGKVNVLPGLDLTTASIGIVPNDDGLALDVAINGLVIPTRARYAAACINGSSNITVRATTARVRGQIGVTASGGRFHVTLENPQVTFTGFDVQASGVPGAVIDLLDLDNEIGGVLATAIEKFVGPMVQDAIEGVKVGPQTMAVLGKNVTVNVAAAGVGFDSEGAEMALDARIQVGGGARSFLYTDDQVPPMRTGAHVDLAIADDTINQLLTGFWAAGGLDLTIPKNMGSYDAITLEAKLPPVVQPGSEGTLRITMADLLVHLTNRGDEITVLAMNVDVALKVEPNAINPGLASITITPPVIRADVVMDKTGMTPETLESVMPIMIEHMMSTFTPLLSVVPVPSVAGLEIEDLNLATVGGYVAASATIR